MNLRQISIGNARKRVEGQIISIMREEHLDYEKVLHLIKTSRIDERLRSSRIELGLLWEMEKEEVDG